MAEIANPRQPSDLYRGYVLSVSVVVYIFNFIDRSVLGILASRLDRSCRVSDTYMGLLGGIAFAIFYTFIGIRSR